MWHQSAYRSCFLEEVPDKKSPDKNRGFYALFKNVFPDGRRGELTRQYSHVPAWKRREHAARNY